MDKLSAFSVAFSNATPLQAQVLKHCWEAMFGRGSDYFANGNDRQFDVSDFYDESTQRLKLIAEVAAEPLPYTNAIVMEDLLDWLVEDRLLRMDSFVLRGIVYKGSFVVTDRHLKAPLNVVSLLPKVSVCHTLNEEAKGEAKEAAV